MRNRGENTKKYRACRFKCQTLDKIIMQMIPYSQQLTIRVILGTIRTFIVYFLCSCVAVEHELK